MRIGFFGDGYLNLEEKGRDGSVVDRRGFMSELNKLGHETFYLVRGRTSTEFNCIDVFDEIKNVDMSFERYKPEWDLVLKFPKLDILIVESRNRIFGAYGGVFLQYKILKHYMNTDTRICMWDFDMNNYPITCDKSIYTGKPYGVNDPHFLETLHAKRHEFIYLFPYEVTSELKTKFNYSKNLHTFLWAINEDFYSKLELPNVKDFDLVYGGSDYNRRKKFEAFYGTPANNGFKVGMTGVWNKKKGSKEFVSQFKLEYFGYLSIIDTFKNINRGLATIQILMDHYVKIGYVTQRQIEGPFSNVITFIDKDIKNSDKYFMKEFCISSDEVDNTLRELQSMTIDEYMGIAKMQQKWLLDNGFAWKNRVKEFLAIIGA